MSEVRNHMGSNTTPVPRRQLVDCDCSAGGHVVPHSHIAIPRPVAPCYNVRPRRGFGPLDRYHLGQWSETMRPDVEYVWPPPPPPPPPHFAPVPHFSNEHYVDPYYGVPPPNNFVPPRRYYPGEWMDVEHLSRFARRPEEELDWTPPPCLPPPPIAFPINSGIINVEDSDEDIVLIQRNPNWVPNCNPKGMPGLPYVHHDVPQRHHVYHPNLPTPHLYAPWIPDDSTYEEPYSTMHCCEYHGP